MATSSKGTLVINVHSASDLIAADSNGKSDPYVIVNKVGETDKKRIFKTKIIKKTLNPTWNEQFRFPVTIQDKVIFTVKDWDRFGSDDPLGNAEVNVETLLTPPNTPHPLTLALKDVAKGKLNVEMTFIEEGLETEITVLSNTKFFKSMNAKLNRDYILIVDKSGSMSGSRWTQARKTVSILAPSICKADPDGITLYLFSDSTNNYEGIKNSSQVEEIFNKVSPGGSTDLARVLKEAFNEHFSNSGKQTTILVVTDGEPNSASEVKKAIRNAADKLKKDEDLSVTFVQIGHDSSATTFLKELDDDLNAKFDIVDTVTAEEMEGMQFEELIAKSICD